MYLYSPFHSNMKCNANAINAQLLKGQIQSASSLIIIPPHPKKAEAFPFPIIHYKEVFHPNIFLVPFCSLQWLYYSKFINCWML